MGNAAFEMTMWCDKRFLFTHNEGFQAPLVRVRTAAKSQYLLTLSIGDLTWDNTLGPTNQMRALRCRVLFMRLCVQNQTWNEQKSDFKQWNFMSRKSLCARKSLTYYFSENCYFYPIQAISKHFKQKHVFWNLWTIKTVFF